MAITDIFSKRQKRLRGEMPDVYIYDKLPKILKIQIIQMWRTIEEFFSDPYVHDYNNIHTIYEEIICILHREYGLFKLYSKSENYQAELEQFFFTETDIDKCLDPVELFFTFKNNFKNDHKIFDDAIKELNHRFQEHGVGYQYENGQIIRIDSQFIHAEIVQPGLQLLNDKNYAGAQEEFLKAHEHYRKGNAKEALNECLKAFESVMKVICKKKEMVM